MNQGFDITVLDVSSASEDGVEVPIVNPRTSERTGLVIKVQGAFAERFQELMARQKKRDALRAKNAVARALNDGADDTAEVMSEVTMTWWTEIKGADGTITKEPTLNEGGKLVPFSRLEARRIYDAYPVIRGQVLAAALDVANFIKD